MSGVDVDAQREATHFKNRVLDLVDTLIKRQPTNPLILGLILPLIELMSNSGQDERQLEDKARGLLRSRIGKAKEAPTSVSVEQASQILEEIHVRARKSKNAVMDVLGPCAVYVSRTLVHAQAQDHVVRTYRASLVDFITRKNSCLKSTFFVDLIRALPTIGWQLRLDLCNLSKEAKVLYRKSQCFYLLQTLISLGSSLVSQLR